MLNLSEHKHSLKLRPHEYTSYASLAILVLLMGIVLTGFSFSAASASGPTPGPAAGSVGLIGEVPETPPKTGATITTPGANQHFSTTPVTVSGSCPNNTLVEVFTNNVFAGSTPCQNGAYSLQIDLLFGSNSLTAQVFDADNQGGPVSNTVQAFFDQTPPAPSSLGPINFSGSQLILETNAIYRGVFPGQALNVPITIIGGVPPFAVHVEWGDSNQNNIPRSNNSVFNATHTYQKPGTYKIIIEATDSQGQVAFLTTSAIVNGQSAAAASTNKNGSSPNIVNKLLVLWPLYAIALTLVVSFWAGERREKKIIESTIDKPTLGITPHPTS